MLRKLALLGHHISHSRSPEIYRRLLGQQIEYDLIDVAREDLIPPIPDLRRDYQGINITTPWKKVFSTYAVPEVAHLGAVNCVRLSTDVSATNTDWTALRELIPAMRKAHAGSGEIVLLGSGVMAGLVIDLCQKHSIPLVQYARARGDQLDQLDLAQDPQLGPSRLLINACGRGFVFRGNLRGTWTFWDFNYAHPQQEMAQKRAMITYVDGQALLELQAKHAIQFWNRTLSH